MFLIQLFCSTLIFIMIIFFSSSKNGYIERFKIDQIPVSTFLYSKNSIDYQNLIKKKYL